MEGLTQRFLDRQAVDEIKIMAMAKEHEIRLYLRLVHVTTLSTVWSMYFP